MNDHTDPRCGTYAGYQAHTRAGTEHCNDCREASRAYMLERRRRSVEVRRREADLALARERARVRLSRMYPTAYAALYAEELEARQ